MSRSIPVGKHARVGQRIGCAIMEAMEPRQLLTAVPDGYYLLASDTVAASGAVTTLPVLEDGVQYQVRVSNTGVLGTVNGNNRPFDAEWFDFGVPGRSATDVSATTGIDTGVRLDGVLGAGHRGEYREDHEYTELVTGAGAELTAHFDDYPYTDNSGQVTIEVFAPIQLSIETTQDGSEDGRSPATLEITRNGTSFSSDLIVYFTLSGSATASEQATASYAEGITEDGADYTVEGATPDAANPGYWHTIIPAGSSSVTVTARPLNDAEDDDTETIDVCLVADLAPGGGGAAYADPATNPANRPPTTQAIVGALKLTATLPSDPFVGDPTVGGRQSLTDLEPRLNDDDPQERDRASSDLDALLAGEPALVPVAEADAAGLQQQGGPQETINRLRSAAGKRRLALEPFTIAFDGATSTFTITLKAYTQDAREYDRAISNESITSNNNPAPITIVRNWQIIENRGGSASFKVIPTASGQATISIQVTYQNAGAEAITDTTRTITLVIAAAQ